MSGTADIEHFVSLILGRMTFRSITGMSIFHLRNPDKLPHPSNPSVTMNAHPSLQKPTSAAYTLIELLAVIAIIAILMTLLFAVIIPAKNHARHAEAVEKARNIVVACKNYVNDYGKFPAVSSAPGTTVYSFGPKTKNAGVNGEQGDYDFDNAELFDVLRAIPSGLNTDHKLNKRIAKYFELGIAKDLRNPRSGFVDGAGYPAWAPKGALMDPWGTQYCIVLDATGADEIAAKDIQKYYSDFEIIRMGAISFSLGKDQILGTKDYPKRYRGKSPNDTDDAVSWQ